MANGTVSNDTGIRDGMRSIATVCKEQGYATGYIGKWHLEWNRKPFVPKARRQGFDYWAVNNCTHRYMDNFYCGDTPEKIRFKGYEPLIQRPESAALRQRLHSRMQELLKEAGNPGTVEAVKAFRKQRKEQFGG